MASDKKLIIDNNSQPNNPIKGGETKVMKTKKAFNVMTSAALAASVVAPAVAVVAPQEAAAATTKAFVDRVPSIADDYESSKGSNDAWGPEDAVSTLYIYPDDLDIAGDQEFELVLSSGIKWVKDPYENSANTVVKNVYVEHVSDQTLTLKTKSGINDGNPIEVPLLVKVDGASGEAKVEIRGKDSSIASGTYTFANIGSGNTVTTIESVKSIAPGSTAKIGTIKIEETSIGAIYNNGEEQEVKIKLPSNVQWVDKGGSEPLTIEFAGGLANNVEFDVGNAGDSSDDYLNSNGTLTANAIQEDDQTLVFKFKVKNKPNTRGTIYIKNAYLKVDSEASLGDIEASVDGTKVSDTDLVIAKAADYGIEIKVDEVKELLAGKSDDITTGKITIKETVANSLVAGRDLEIYFPDWVKVANVKKEKDNINLGTASYNSDRNRVSFSIPENKSTTTKAEIELKFDLTIEGNKTGDIEAEIKGAGIEAQKVTIAKAVAPISVETEKTNVKIGVQGQETADIIITENVKGALEKQAEAFKDEKLSGTEKADGSTVVTLTLPEGVTFSATPDVSVIEGNLKVDSVKRVNDNRTLQFAIDSESTKPSKIKISGVKLSVDRTVPEGPVELKIGGLAVVENAVANNDEDVFKTSNAVTLEYATTVTPAPGEETKTAVFTIGSTTYTVNGEEKALDVAPYVESGRTMLPIRYVAEAVGVSEDNIIWNSATRTATFIKGDRIAQVKIGSKALVINGVTIQMDVEAKVKDGRTVLPLRYVAQALGANVTYDEVAKTVTVESK